MSKDIVQDNLRNQVIATVRRFRGNWVDLSKCLALVESEQSYRSWGYGSFSGYCTGELKLKKLTVEKLLRSYRFLAREETSYLKDVLDPAERTSSVADLESVNVLRKARSSKRISEDDYRRIRSAVLDDGASPREVGSQYRSLLEAARQEPADSREAWERRRKDTVRRTLVSLRRIKENLISDRYLSAEIAEDVKTLILKIENEFSRE